MLVSLVRHILCAAVVMGFSQTAQAAVVVSPVGASYSYTVGGPILPGNVDLSGFRPNTEPFYSSYTIPQGTLTLRNAEIVTNNDKHGFFEHVRPKDVARNENYLAVFGSGFLRTPGAAVFSLTTPATTFAFTWGSIDAQNWLTVTNAKNEKYTITGADLMANVAHIDEGRTSKYFSLTDMAGIVKVVLRSCSDAFEISNIRITSVPLPATFSLLLAAMLGLFVVRRQRAMR